MKLLSVRIARSLWFFHTDDLNPRGKDLHQALSKLQERYSFTKAPTFLEIHESTIKNEGSTFVGGSFKTSRGETIDVNLTLYAEGIVGESRSSTTDTDAFLSDFMEWVPKSLGLPAVQGLPKNKRYISEVYVNFDKALISINPKLAKLCALLQTHEAASKSFDLSSLSFSPDPRMNPSPPITGFRIERADNTPFSEERYWSFAPVGTERHLEILEAFEAVLKG